MDVRDLLKKQLKIMGADGLYQADLDHEYCGCSLNDLAPCAGYDGIPTDCVAAVVVGGKFRAMKCGCKGVK